MSHPNLTPAQAERLEMLIEECGEVIQAGTKILRHGYKSFNPDSRQLTDNREDLEEELSELMAIAFAMSVLGDIDIPEDAVDGIWQKKLKWTHHQDG